MFWISSAVLLLKRDQFIISKFWTWCLRFALVSGGCYECFLWWMLFLEEVKPLMRICAGAQVQMFLDVEIRLMIECRILWKERRSGWSVTLVPRSRGRGNRCASRDVRNVLFELRDFSLLQWCIWRCWQWLRRHSHGCNECERVGLFIHLHI